MGEQHANGWHVSRHPLVADVTVGVIANPMSGRDFDEFAESDCRADRIVVADPVAVPLDILEVLRNSERASSPLSRSSIR